MSNVDFSVPQRQSILGVGVILVQKVRKMVNVFISIFVLQYGVKADLSSIWVNVTLAILIIGLLVVSILTYRNFYFYAKEGKFIIEKGVLGKEKVHVPFERIQTVNIHQNLIQRILGVVGLKIDTAGSSTKELEIAALPKVLAKQIQSFLIERKSDASSERENVINDSNDERIEEKQALMELGLVDLVKVGLTENHLKTAGILFAILNGYFWQFQSYFESYTEDFLNLELNWLNYWALFLPLVVLASFIGIALLSVLQSVLRFYNLQFYCDKEGVKLESGLLKRAEYQIPEKKIQLIKWSTNPLRKLVGFKTVHIKQASSVALQDKASVMIPACKEEQLNRILDTFYTERKLSNFEEYPTQKWFQVQLSILFAGIPALVFALIGIEEPSFLVLALGWLFIATFLSIRYARNMFLKINHDMLQLQKGWVFPECIYLHLHKLQSIRFQQNMFQKRRGLANLVFYTAAGSFKMWQLKEQQALDIYNYGLYKIESSDKSWM